MYPPTNARDPLTHSVEFATSREYGDHRVSAKLLTKVPPNLYLGGTIGGMYLPSDVRHFVSMFAGESYTLLNKGQLLTNMAVRLDDRPWLDQGEANAVLAAAHVVAAGMLTAPTMVVCQAGVTSSPPLRTGLPSCRDIMSPRPRWLTLHRAA